MLHFWLNSLIYFLLICCQVKPFNEIFPVNQCFHFVLAIVQKEVDLFGGDRHIQRSEGFFELQIVQFSSLLSISLAEYLLKSFRAGSQNFFDIVDNLPSLSFHWFSFIVIKFSCSDIGSFDNTEIFILPIISWEFFINRVIGGSPLAFKSIFEFLHGKSRSTSSQIPPNVLDICFLKTVAEQFFSELQKSVEV